MSKRRSGEEEDVTNTLNKQKKPKTIAPIVGQAKQNQRRGTDTIDSGVDPSIILQSLIDTWMQTLFLTISGLTEVTVLLRNRCTDGKGTTLKRFEKKNVAHFVFGINESNVFRPLGNSPMPSIPRTILANVISTIQHGLYSLVSWYERLGENDTINMIQVKNLIELHVFNPLENVVNLANHSQPPINKLDFVQQFKANFFVEQICVK